MSILAVGLLSLGALVILAVLFDRAPASFPCLRWIDSGEPHALADHWCSPGRHRPRLVAL